MTLPRLLLLSLPFVLLSGCQKSEVSYSRIPKETKPAAAAASLPPAHPPIGSTPAAVSPEASSPANDLVWSAPARWEPKPLGPMRRGSFRIKSPDGKEADLSVFVFPGAAGGLADNVNRWRGQIGLEPLSSEKLTESLARQKNPAGLDFTIVDLAGANSERILGAILQRGPNSWFFKLKGPSELVASEKSAFLDFLNSIKAP